MILEIISHSTDDPNVHQDNQPRQDETNIRADDKINYLHVADEKIN